ncbi:MAG: hypothetical protein Q6K99_08595 [Thermostichales cyanobacterium BF4_bins_65]
MKIKWNMYDDCDRFNLSEAASLWEEIEPSGEYLTKVENSCVQPVQRRIERIDRAYREITGREMYDVVRPMTKEELEQQSKERGYPLSPTSLVRITDFRYLLTREELIAVAERLGERPKFLYPEEREVSKGSSDKKLDNRERRSLYKIIEALFKKAKLDPNDRNMIGILKTQCGLDDETVRDHLRAAGIPIPNKRGENSRSRQGSPSRNTDA